MKLEEYKALLNDMMDADKSASTLVSLTDALTVDIAELDALRTERTALSNKVNELRDTNSKLALRITGVVDNTTDPIDAIETKFMEGVKEFGSTIN